MELKAPMNLMAEPERLGKYEIKAILGEGGMGVVYKGYDPHLARDVAIKTIRKSLLAGRAGNELRDRFNREAQAEGSLIHPNIVAVYEFQEDNSGMPFFVMEYVEGHSLKDILSRGMHFNLDTALHLITQLLSALAYTHQRGVIHRDIKPANILLLEDDSIKIADFGIAKVGTTEFTKTGQIMGTPQYASPEQTLGLKTDARSDLYSAAVLLYELVSGSNPFADKPLADFSRLENRHFENLEISDPKQLATFKTVIKKALAKDPAKRYQNAEAFSAALAPLSARVPPPTLKVSRISATTKNALWLGASGGVGLLIVALALYLSSPTEDSAIDRLTSLTTSSSELSSTISPPSALETNTASNLTPEENAKISRLLKTAKLHLLVGRTILPEGSNAYHAFNMVRQIDTANKEAQSGIKEVEDKVVQQIQQLVAEGEAEQANSHLKLARNLYPASRELQSLALNIGSK